MEITSIPVPGSQYNEVVILDEYNGVYSLLLGKAGDKRNFWKMVYPETKERQPGTKAIPMKVTLGDQHAAPDMLRKLADALEGQGSQSGHGDQVDEDSDVPF